MNPITYNPDTFLINEISLQESLSDQLALLIDFIRNEPVTLLEEFRSSPESVLEVTNLLTHLDSQTFKKLISQSTVLSLSLEILSILNISVEQLSLLKAELTPDESIALFNWFFSNNYKNHAKIFLTNPARAHLFIKNNQHLPVLQKALLQWFIEDKAAIVKNIYHSVDQLNELYEHGVRFMPLEDFQGLFNQLICVLERLHHRTDCLLLKDIREKTAREEKDLLELCTFSGSVCSGRWYFFEFQVKQCLGTAPMTVEKTPTKNSSAR